MMTAVKQRLIFFTICTTIYFTSIFSPDMSKEELNLQTNKQERIAALYCRFSREEDDNESDCSNSIKNQKVLLKNYAVEHNLSDYEFYVDDGFSGTMFERPDFKRMIADIEAGTVDTVIVKDYCAIMGLNQKDLENQGVLA